MQQPGGQTWNGGHRFQMGGPGTTGPPLATALLVKVAGKDRRKSKTEPTFKKPCNKMVNFVMGYQ